MRRKSILSYNTFAPCGCFSAFENQEIDFLKEYKHWFLVLNRKQSFLGRSLLMLKSHKADEIELTDEEVMEKHLIYCQWRMAVGKAFGSDKINQALSGNEEGFHRGHLHWHFIPRYRRPIFFEGKSFSFDTPETQSLPVAKIDTKIKTEVSTREKIKQALLKFL